MKQIRSILSLHLQNPTASIRYLSRASGCSRPVVAQYCALLTSHPLSLSELGKLDDPGLRAHLGLTQPPVLATDVNQTLIEWLHANLHRLNHVGMTRRLLHEDYRRDHPDGLAYSQFCFILKQSFQGLEASALLDHKAGDALYLDFTGHKVHWQDLDAHISMEEIFVAVLGASGAFFALPIPS